MRMAVASMRRKGIKTSGNILYGGKRGDLLEKQRRFWDLTAKG